MHFSPGIAGGRETTIWALGFMDKIEPLKISSIGEWLIFPSQFSHMRVKKLSVRVWRRLQAQGNVAIRNLREVKPSIKK